MAGTVRPKAPIVKVHEFAPFLNELVNSGGCCYIPIALITNPNHGPLALPSALTPINFIRKPSPAA